MKAGESFDPVEVTRRLKLYPVDVIDARPDISDGPKRLYARLFRIALTTDRRKNPWPGFVYASEKYLAARLGKSESAIRRDSLALRSLGLLRVERPKHQGSNHCFFLWHPDFQRSDSSVADTTADQEQRSDSSVEQRSDVSVGIRLHHANVSVEHHADVSVANKEEQIVLANTEERVSGRRMRFLEFQSAYPEPKREFKVDSSCRAYLSVIDGKPGEHERLVAGLARYKASEDWRRSLSEDGGRYIPAMETFIVDRRYLDHPPAADEAPDEYRPADEFEPEHGLLPAEEFAPEEAAR